jgi:hypothetical protein
MKIFISWSGPKARRVAVGLKAFLQDVNQRLVPWFSDADIPAGDRWAVDLANQLDNTEFGIVCVTNESMTNPWTMFEAGALSKSMSGGRVCPYLIDINRSQLAGPLNQFQAKECTREQTRELLASVNMAMGADALQDSRIDRYFDVYWPSLEAEIASANKELAALPASVTNELLNLLPPVFYRVAEIQMLALTSGLPIWKVNLNQAAIHVWRELIQVAITERRVDALLTQVLETAPALRDRLEEPLKQVTIWSRETRTPSQ